MKLNQKSPTLLLLPLFFIFAVTSCKKSELNGDLPSCVSEDIESYEAQGDGSMVISIYKYERDGGTYYRYNFDCCDMFDLLYDGECNQVCAVSGGIAGAGDGNCPDWTGEAVETLLWERD